MACNNSGCLYCSRRKQTVYEFILKDGPAIIASIISESGTDGKVWAKMRDQLGEQVSTIKLIGMKIDRSVEGWRRGFRPIGSRGRAGVPEPLFSRCAHNND